MSDVPLAQATQGHGEGGAQPEAGAMRWRAEHLENLSNGFSCYDCGVPLPEYITAQFLLNKRSPPWFCNRCYTRRRAIGRDVQDRVNQHFTRRRGAR